MRGYTQDKDAYLKRLRRIEGQVRGLQRMVENDTYCIDILTQVSAVTRGLQAVALGLVEDHLGHCVTQAIEEGGPEATEKVKEASEAIARLVRSLVQNTDRGRSSGGTSKSARDSSSQSCTGLGSVPVTSRTSAVTVSAPP
jgi:CsoR family transcriptional regulator, copper-sensing transcriptional repressor